MEMSPSNFSDTSYLLPTVEVVARKFTQYHEYVVILTSTTTKVVQIRMGYRLSQVSTLKVVRL